MLLYVCHSNRLMGGRGSAELTIKGPAVIHSPTASHSTPNLRTTWLQWHISILCLTLVYQLDQVASQQILHQDPNVLCNHPHGTRVCHVSSFTQLKSYAVNTHTIIYCTILYFCFRHGKSGMYFKHLSISLPLALSTLFCPSSLTF